MADGLDEQLHETRGGIFSYCISLPALARGLPLVPGETRMDGSAPAQVSPKRQHVVITDLVSNVCRCLGHPSGC